VSAAGSHSQPFSQAATPAWKRLVTPKSVMICRIRRCVVRMDQDRDLAIDASVMPAASMARRAAVSGSGAPDGVPGIGVALAHSASNKAIRASRIGERWMTNVVSIEREVTAAGISANWSWR